jgi:DNA repair exonuclease SbcCD nuclease subunit
MSAAGQWDDIMLKLVHTADWHLGRQFRSFPEDGALKLSRARLEVLDRILLTADRYAVDAVLCAGDLFDEPNPLAEWWEQAAARLGKCPSARPVFLLPGNHDPLTTESIWVKGHKFRGLLPDWIHVVDRQDFQYNFPNGAVLYAVPCMSKAGQRDPTECIPKRVTGDERIRIGMVHGSTFDAKDWQTNFPIHPDAVLDRGLDYLAVGDTHSFRNVPPARLHPPTIYPGAPEATAFDEKDPGCVAVVFINRQRVATVRRERIARWTWEERSVTSIDELRAIVRCTDLADRVLRLHVNMKVPAPEYDEAEMLIEELQGTLARHARAGVLELDRNGLELETATVDQHCSDLPGVLRSVVTRLTCIAEKDPAQRLIAERALFHLYRSAKRKAS